MSKKRHDGYRFTPHFTSQTELQEVIRFRSECGYALKGRHAWAEPCAARGRRSHRADVHNEVSTLSMITNWNPERPGPTCSDWVLERPACHANAPTHSHPRRPGIHHLGGPPRHARNREGGRAQLSPAAPRPQERSRAVSAPCPRLRPAYPRRRPSRLTVPSRRPSRRRLLSAFLRAGPDSEHAGNQQPAS